MNFNHNLCLQSRHRMDQENENQGETFHDITSESFILMALAGFTLLNDLTYRPLIQIASWAVVFIYQLVLLYLVILTMFTTSFDKTITMSLIQIVIMCCGLSVLKFVFVFTHLELKEFAYMIRNGVFHYSGPDIGEDSIRRARVAQVRFVIYMYKRAVMFTMVITFLVMPTIKWNLKVEGKFSDIMSPYLPHPIDMPFETNSFLGYLCGSLLIFVFTFTMFTTCIMQITITVSCVTQLTAQIELLNFSLRNIEKRAFLRFKASYGIKLYNLELEEVYSSLQFQRCIYDCLMENAHHFFAIIR